MSDEHDYATIAAELLGNRKPDPRSRSVDRLQGISVVAQAMAKRARRRAQVRALTFSGFFLTAAGIALVAGWFGARAPAQVLAPACSAPSCAGGVSPSRFGTIAGRPFEPGQSIASGRGRATVVEFGPVTRIALDEMSELEYRQGDRTQRFALLSGSVHLKVDKLRAGQRFLVETVDAQVEVRGTVFDVALAAADDACVSPRTRVSVEEGVVEVRFHGKTSSVHPGESWPSSCEERAAVAAPEPSVKPPLSPAAEGVGRALDKSKRVERVSNPAAVHGDAAAPVAAAAKPSPEPTAMTASLLAEQNNLYAEAAALHRSGRLGDALSAYERLLARFPNGPLAESASVGRLRILAKSERARAKGEARRYLSRYPHGIASAEAQALLLEP